MTAATAIYETLGGTDVFSEGGPGLTELGERVRRGLPYAALEAVMELLVHLDAEDAPEDRVAIGVELPAGFEVAVIRAEELPAAWRSYPAPEALKDLGTAWARTERTAVLQVPSAVIPEESNYLLNPRHPYMSHVTVRPAGRFTFDRRLWKRQ